MGTYFNETSEIQASDSNIQTLYLMHPNYLPSCSQHTQTTPNSMLFTAPHALGQDTLPHAPPHQQLVGIPLDSNTTTTNSSFIWTPTLNPMDGPQGLYLSLPPHKSGTQSAVGPGSGSGGGVEGIMIVGRSKYLKVIQELLDEVVSVVDFEGCPGGTHKKKGKEVEGSSGGGGGGGGESKRSVDELVTNAQRQELQMKKAKLLNMLDEVEKRYNQYHTQMQLVISSFEQISGIGSAKSYTYLALQTVSRQFRCLKDAISSHIKTTNKILGEDQDIDNTNNCRSNEGGVGGSRLRFVDHHQIRQQQVLQQLGVMHHHNAWRPQRGLPERAVSVLRAWLFEHFLHPYPKDSDKHMLAKQTGLTRSQVSNWFINARVRLWKPMVEEMYMEEMKSQHDQKDNNSNHNKDQSTSKETHISQPQQLRLQPQPQPQPQSDNVISCMIHHQSHHLDQNSTNDMISNMSTMSTTSTQGFTLIGSSSDMNSLIGHSPKKQRSGSDIQNSPSSILSMEMETKTHIHSQNQINKYGQDPRNSSIMRNESRLNPYVIPDIGRFNPDQIGTHRYQYPGNNVSLTLGLPRCENLPTLSNDQQNFIGEGEFCGISMGQPSHPSNVYESIDIQSRKRFAAHLLHDFVA